MKNAFAAVTTCLALAAVAPAIGQAPPPPVSVASPDAETLAVAREVITLAFPPSQRQAMFSRVGDSMMTQMRNAAVTGAARDPGALAIVDRFDARFRSLADRALAEHSDAIFDSFARAYSRQFTRDELVQIRAFVATTAGAHYIQRSSDLLSDPDVAAANTAYMRSLFQAIEPLQAEMRTELVAHFSHRRH